MKTSLLDFRFGWRWLLPYAPRQKLSLMGFGESDRAFWFSDEMIGDWVHRSRHSDGCIINADNSSPYVPKGHVCAVDNGGQWVAVVGSGKAVALWYKHLVDFFPHIDVYGLLPSTNPRVVVPLAKSHHACVALTLHQPGRRIARIGVRLAGMLARMRIYFPLRRRMLLIATRRKSLPVGAVRAGLQAKFHKIGCDYALYLGTPDENRKTVVLPLGDSVPKMVVKVGSSFKARKALNNEAATLKTLSESALKQKVPHLQEFIENEHCAALCQEYRMRTKTNRQMYGQAVVEFLIELSQINLRTRPLQAILDEMSSSYESGVQENEIDDSSTAMWAWLQRQAGLGLKVWECFGHGDFAPWNCTWTAQGLFVFDWEESGPQALAFGDAFYFAVAPTLHIGKTFDPEAAYEKALALGAQVATQGRVSGEVLQLHFALWTYKKLGEHPGYAAIVEHLARVVI